MSVENGQFEHISASQRVRQTSEKVDPDIFYFHWSDLKKNSLMKNDRQKGNNLLFVRIVILVSYSYVFLKSF